MSCTKIRVIKTSSGANAVQVVYYQNRKRVIYKHIGSAKTDKELESLKAVAQDLIVKAKWLCKYKIIFLFIFIFFINIAL